MQSHRASFTSKLIGTVLSVVLLFGGLYLISYKKINIAEVSKTAGVSKTVDTSKSTAVLETPTTVVPSNDPTIKCYANNSYVAVEKSLADSVGSNILIRYKSMDTKTMVDAADSDTDTKTLCDYSFDSTGNEFEIKNENAEYFLTFAGHFAVLDSGTAPEPRGLIVYDLNSKKKVFTDSYAKPVTASSSVLTYWRPSGSRDTKSTTGAEAVIPTTQNCPELNTYISNGLGALILNKVSVDLETGNKALLGETKCIAVQ